MSNDQGTQIMESYCAKKKVIAVERQFCVKLATVQKVEKKELLKGTVKVLHSLTKSQL